MTFPGNVTAGQQGNLALAVRHTGPATLAEISVTLTSEGVDVHNDQSSRVVLKALGSGETTHLTLTYSVRSHAAPDPLQGELTIPCDERNVSTSHATTWLLRRLPRQRRGTLISSALLLLSAVLTWDVLKQLTEPLRACLETRREADKESAVASRSAPTRESG
ncbi:MAG: hypothetical protein AB7N91_25480 [Candidatus Tectimicrobiota bacterium]